MADETPSATPETSAPEPGGEQAKAFFEKAAEKAGIPAAPAPERSAGGVQTRAEGQRDPKDATPSAPDENRAHAEFARRRAEQHQQRREEASARVLERLAQKLEAEAQRTPASEVSEGDAADAGNPFDKETQYWEWEEWNRKALETGILSRVEEMLKPVTTFFEQQQQRNLQVAEQQRRDAARQEWLAEMRGIARDAHETYAATPQGEGYMDRITWHVGHDGDPERGIPPADGALALGFMAAFPKMPEAEARSMARRHVDGIMMVAQRYNQLNPDAPVNPAAALDMFTRVQIAAALDRFGGGGQVGGNGNGHLPAPQAGPSPAQARAASLKASASSAVAGSVAEGGTKGGGDLVGALRVGLASGTLGVEEMRELAVRYLGSANRQNQIKMAKLAAQVAQELRQSA